MKKKMFIVNRENRIISYRDSNPEPIAYQSDTVTTRQELLFY